MRLVEIPTCLLKGSVCMVWSNLRNYREIFPVNKRIIRQEFLLVNDSVDLFASLKSSCRRTVNNVLHNCEQ